MREYRWNSKLFSWNKFKSWKFNHMLNACTIMCYRTVSLCSFIHSWVQLCSRFYLSIFLSVDDYKQLKWAYSLLVPHWTDTIVTSNEAYQLFLQIKLRLVAFCVHFVHFIKVNIITYLSFFFPMQKKHDKYFIDYFLFICHNKLVVDY